MFDELWPYRGYLAGLATSMLWTATSLFFTASAKRLGTTVLNTIRILIAVVLLTITHRLINGVWVPHSSVEQIGYLALSGWVGLSLGDQALFTAFVEIGPRLSSLIMTTSPLWAAFFGWMALGEVLPGTAWVGIGLTVGGVGWVVLERPKGPSRANRPTRVRGYVFAMIGAACQAGGLLLSKKGMGHGWLDADERMAPQTATMIRMWFAGLGMIPIVWLHARRLKRRRAAGVQRERVGSPRMGMVLAGLGAIVGPFLGVWMSLVASDQAPLGIAQTLCSLTPIFILPVVAIVHKERITARAAVGACMAVLGSALLVWQRT